MSKKISDPIFRQSILNKFNGLCAYCGTDLSTGGFHIDHFIPKRRYSKTYQELVDRGIYERKPTGKDEFDNYMPCCAPCNSSKSDLSIEEFRDRVYDRVIRLNKNSHEYNIAKRFGLVIEVNKQVIFHFEKFING